MALIPLGSVDVDLDQVTAAGPIEATTEDESLFAFDIHLVGTVVTVVADGRDEAEAWREEAVEDFADDDAFDSGGFTLDIAAVQAVGPAAAYDAFDDLPPLREATFEVFLDGTVAELTFASLSAAEEARQDLLDAVNDGP